ncbi:hypothetical protein GAMM_170018 [Gammaproteobacteria bacterium]
MARVVTFSVPEKQAEMMAETIGDKLTTRLDLEQVRSELKRDIESSRDKTIIWLGGIIAAGVTIIITVLGFLISRLH